jgi:ferritin
MLSKKMTDALNTQVNNEMYSAYLYMAMSAYADSVGLKGFATWFMVQYHEEMLHAMKIYEYIQRQGSQVILKQIDQPASAFDSPLDMFQKTLKHEQFITKCINDLVDLAREDHDYATEIFLHWYVTEQVEEEENDNDIIGRLELIGESTQGLLMLDAEMGRRTVTVPTVYSNGIEAAIKGGD